MKKPILAFLVCAYNAEKYIAQTIESVLAQTFDDIALYIRDNGSTDLTYEICKKYSEKDSRVILMHNAYNGHDYGHSLPHTFDKPFSKYLTHLDADDFVHSDFARITVEMAEKYTADIVVVGSKNFNDGAQDFCSIRTQNNLVYSENDTLTVDELMDKYSQLRPLWAKIYNTEFFYNIDWQQISYLYSKLVRGHDTTLSLSQILHAKKVVFLNECLHYHRYRNDSDFIDNFMPDYRRVFDGLVLYDLGLKLLEKFNCKSSDGIERIRNILYGHLYSLVDLLVDNNNQNFEYKYLFLEELVNDYRFQQVCELLNNFNIQKLLKPIFESLSMCLNREDNIAESFIKKFVYSQYIAKSIVNQKLILIAAIFDINNHSNFGLELLEYWNSTEKIPKWYMKFVAMEKKQQEEVFNDVEKMREIQGFEDSKTDYNKYKNFILDLIDQNRIIEANEFNEYILDNRPLDRECLYFKAIILAQLNKYDDIFDLNLLIKLYYPEDDDLKLIINN